MTPNRVAVAMEKYEKQIPKNYLSVFQNYLGQASDDCLDELMMLPIKGKTKTLLFSIFLGGIAVDRFYVGDKGLGAVKLILRILSLFLFVVPILGMVLNFAAFVWYVVDIFIAKRVNYYNLTAFLNRHKEVTTSAE